MILLPGGLQRLLERAATTAQYVGIRHRRSAAPSLKLPFGLFFDTRFRFYSQSHVPSLAGDSGKCHQQFARIICTSGMIETRGVFIKNQQIKMKSNITLHCFPGQSINISHRKAITLCTAEKFPTANLTMFILIRRKCNISIQLKLLNKGSELQQAKGFSRKLQICISFIIVRRPNHDREKGLLCYTASV